MIKLDSSEKTAKKGEKSFLVIWFSKSKLNLGMFRKKIRPCLHIDVDLDTIVFLCVESAT